MTGSCLGRTLNTEFKLSAGDLSLWIETLDFEEFTEAFGMHEAYGEMELYGTAHPEEFNDCSCITSLTILSAVLFSPLSCCNIVILVIR